MAVMAFDDEERPWRSPTTTDHGLSGSSSPPMSVGRCGWRDGSRQALGQQPRLGAVLDAVRSLQAVGPGRGLGPPSPDASPRRRTCSSPTPAGNILTTYRRGTGMSGRIEGRTASSTGGCSGLGLATVRRFVEESSRGLGHRRHRRRRRRRAGHRARWTRGGHLRARRRDLPGGGGRAVRTGGPYSSVDIAFNNAGISPPEDDSILDDRPRGLAACAGGQPDQVASPLQGRPPLHDRAEAWLDHQTSSFVAVMGAATSQSPSPPSKGGVLSMSRDWGAVRRGVVRVNALCPGP